MKKAAGYFSEVIKKILFIGFSIQIILGIIWMCFNLLHLQVYTVTDKGLYFLLQGLMTQYYLPIYLIQLTIAWFSADYLLRLLVTPLKERVFWCLVLVSFLPGLQCHLAITPYSLTASLTLLEFTILMRSFIEPDRIVNCFVKGCGIWILLALLLPEYVFLGGLPIAITWIFLIMQMKTVYPSVLWKKKMVQSLIVGVLFMFLVITITSLLRYEPMFTRYHLTFRLLHRFIWPTYMSDKRLWPEEIRKALGNHIFFATQMEEYFAERLLPRFSKPELVKYYREMIGYAWILHKTLIIKGILWDILGYAFSLLILPIQLLKKGYISGTIRNYEIFLQQCPVFAKFYVQYSCWWYYMVLVIGCIGTFVGRICKGSVERDSSKIQNRKNKRWIPVFCFLSAMGIVLFYSLREAGLMDYKRTVAVNQLWIAGLVYCLRKDMRQ